MEECFCLSSVYRDCIIYIRTLFITLRAIIWSKFVCSSILFFVSMHQSVVYFPVNFAKFEIIGTLVVIYFVYHLLFIYSSSVCSSSTMIENSNVSIVKKLKSKRYFRSINRWDSVCNFSKRCSLDWQSRRTSARERLSNFVRLRVIYSSNESRVSCVFDARPRSTRFLPAIVELSIVYFWRVISLTQISMELSMKNCSLLISCLIFFTFKNLE